MSIEIRKQATDNPILDEIIYQCQNMLQHIVLKDEERANKNETIESLKRSDQYKIIKEGKDRYELYDYTYDLLIQIPSLTKLKAIEY